MQSSHVQSRHDGRQVITTLETEPIIQPRLSQLKDGSQVVQHTTINWDSREHMQSEAHKPDEKLLSANDYQGRSRRKIEAHLQQL